MYIEIGPEKVKVTPPASPSTAMAIIRMIEASPEFAGGAALAVCCPQLLQRAQIEINYADLYKTGRQTFDFIVAQLIRGGKSGGDALEIAARACGEATAAVIAELPIEAEVEEAGKD